MHRVWAQPAVLGLWLLVALGRSLAADPVPTPAHHAYTKLYKDFDEGAKLSDGHQCYDEVAKLEGTVLSTTKQHSVHACRQECQTTQQCSSWLMCEDDKGCLDGTGSTIGKHMCQLREETRKPWGIPQPGHHIALPSNFASGYVKRREGAQQTFWRQLGAPTTKVLMATAAPSPSECKGPEAADMAQMLLMSKQDYARWHSYELHVSTAVNPGGHEFSRAATVLKLLQDTPASEAEWILYMDPQTVFDAPTVLFNFEFYAGRDLVLACNIWLLKAGDTVCEMGVMLVRNSERSKALFERLDSMATESWAQDGSDRLGLALQKVLQEDSGALLHRLHKEGDMCMNCDWSRIDLEHSGQTKVTKEWGEANTNWNLYIANFFGCDFCNAFHGDSTACAEGLKAHFRYQFCTLQRLAKAVHEEAAEGVPLQKLASLHEYPGFDLQQWLNAKPVPNQVLQSKRAASSNECYDRCMAEPGCSFWVWCNQAGGCDERGVFNGTHPYQVCTLMQLPLGVSPYQWQRGPEASTFSSGYVTGAGAGYQREHSRHRIAVLSGIPTNPCALPWGDWYVSLGMQNHQDWARLHGYEMHVMAAATDVRIRPGPWQKIAMIRQALDAIPRDRAEWLCWIDMDIVLADPTFTFPLDKVNYTDRDIIIWGGKKQILAGDAEYGLNTGVMLVRNTDWSRRLLDMTAHFGQFPPNMTTEQVLKDALPTYDIGMLEQMSMVYILMQDPDMIKRMYFEHGYCFNCWYRNMDDPRIDHPAFVVHFAGCKMCAGLHVNKLGLCDTVFLRNYVDAFSRMIVAAPEKGL